MPRWSRTEIEALINLYQSHQFLYDTKHEDYHNRNKRDTVITGFSERLSQIRGNKFTLIDIKCKIKTLRTQYGAEKQHMAEKLRAIAAGPSEDGVMDVYEPKLWCYKSLAFLEDYSKVGVDNGNTTEDPKNQKVASPIIRTQKPPQEKSHAMIVFDKEDVFASFVSYELKQITDSRIFQETKWKIQMALREGIERQMEMNSDLITEVVME